MYLRIASVLFLQIAGTGLAYLLHLLLARFCGVTEYGKISLAFVWITLLNIPILLGMDGALLKILSVERMSHSYKNIKHSIRIALKSSTLNIICISVIVLILIHFVPTLNPLFKTYYRFILLIAYLTAILTLLLQSLRAMGCVSESLIPRGVLLPLLIMAMMGLFFGSLHIEPTVVSYFRIYSTAVSAVIILSILFLLRTFPTEGPEHVISRDSHKRYKSLMALAFPMCLSSSMYIIHTQTDIFLIGFMLPIENVGIYAATIRISRLLSIPLAATIFYITPHIARLHAEQEPIDLQKLINRSAALVTLTTVPLCGMVILFAKPILGIFGPEFQKGTFSLIILCLGQTVNAVSGPTGNLLNMTGLQNSTVLIVGVSNVLNFALNVLGIRAFGIVGAAAATTVSTIFWNICMVYIAKKRLNIVMYQWIRRSLGGAISC